MFCRELLRRPELDAVFVQYSSNGCILSTLDLRDFLLDQDEDASLVHAQSLILTYELNEWGMQPKAAFDQRCKDYVNSKKVAGSGPPWARVYLSGCSGGYIATRSSHTCAPLRALLKRACSFSPVQLSGTSS